MPDANWVCMIGEHDRDCFCRLARGLNHGRGRRKNHVDLHAHKFGGEPRKLVNVVGPAKFNHDVFALDPAEVAQADPQGIDAARPSRRWSEAEVSDVSDLCRLLRARRDRPSDYRTNNNSDDIASSHCLHQGRDYAE
jgi:hypothetical protein